MNESSEDFKTRFNRAIAMRNIKPVELSEKTNISKSTISHYMSGYTKPKSDKLFVLAHALDVNEGWLMGLDVPMEDVKPDSSRFAKVLSDEREMLRTFSMLTDDNKKRSIHYAQNLFQIQQMEEEQRHLIPVAAHNDFAGDPEQQRLMLEDIKDMEDNW